MKNELLLQEIEELRRELQNKEGSSSLGGGGDFRDAMMLREEMDNMRRQQEEKTILQLARIDELQK